MATYDTIDPSTGEVIETHDVMTREQADAAVDRAHAAFDGWRRTPIEERAEVVRAIAGQLRDSSDELADLASREMGKTTRQAAQEVQLVAAIAEWEADHGPEALADEERPLRGGRAIVTHQPIGVILGIQPWNFPYYQAARYSLANLVAGNTVLLKHAQNVWGSAKRLVELYHEAGVPQGAMVGLYTDDRTTESLIGHEHVRGVTFTGSDTAGAAVAEAAGRHRRKSVLELGSNDAYVVLSDADVDSAVQTCVMGRTYNNGETCVAAKRFVVADAVYDEFRDRFVEQMGALRMGDPREEGTGLGPMARQDLRDRLAAQVRESVEAGATVALGGEVPDRDGWFYPATVLEDVAPGQPAYDEELFGPVASMIRVADDDEAMRVANDSRYGLGGGIFSADVERAVRLARDEFDTGMVNVNGYNLAQPHLPFGGVKDSGYGREHGGYGIHEFVNTKTVMITE